MESDGTFNKLSSRRNYRNGKRVVNVLRRKPNPDLSAIKHRPAQPTMIYDDIDVNIASRDIKKRVY